MKTFMKSFSGLAFTIMMALGVISCDPCSGVVCENGTCSNGSCVCEPGYEKEATSCVGVNKAFVGDGMISATVLTVDSSGSSATTNNVAYTLETISTTDPYTFKIISFNSLANNDITFTVSSTNYDVISAMTVNTGAGYSYALAGSKTGNQVQLTITDQSNQTTYTLSYLE